MAFPQCWSEVYQAVPTTFDERELDDLTMPVVPAGLPSELLTRRPDLRQAEQNLICECGLPIDETTDRDKAPAFVAETVTCWACAARERKAKGMRSNGGEIPPGTRWKVRDRSQE